MLYEADHACLTFQRTHAAIRNARMTTSVEPVPQLAEGSANHHVKAIQGVLQIKSVQFNHLNAVLSHVMIT